VVASPGTSAVRLDWALPPAAAAKEISSWQLRYRLATTSAWTTKDLAANVRANEIGRLTNGLAYRFGLRAKTTYGGWGDWSADVAATPGSTAPAALPAPAAPTSVTGVLGATPGQIQATWAPGAAVPNSPVTRFELAYTSDTDRTVRIGLGDAAADVTTAAFAATQGASDTVLVRAVGPYGASAWVSSAAVLAPQFTLPVVHVDTDGGAPITTTEDYVDGSTSISPAPGGPASDALKTSVMEIKGHGNTTWTAPKKPYHVKLDKSASLLGMPKSKHWLLLANYFDRSFIRNAVTFRLGSQSNLAWTPKSRFVEVVVNGRYDGLYQLTEQSRIDGDRVDIDELTPDDNTGDAVTGGYLMERDGRWTPQEEAGFKTNSGQPIALDDPEEPTPQQLSYITGYLNSFEATLNSTNFKDPVNGYAKYIDVDSFVDWYLVQELVHSNDVGYASEKFFKPRNGKLTLGPLWDFDLSLGTSNPKVYPATGWWARSRVAWFSKLFTDPAFVAKFNARWHALRTDVTGLNQYIDEEAALVKPAAAWDRKRWAYTGPTFDAEISTVRTFLNARANWIDTQVPADEVGTQ
jgi:hypothetical protein